jgi:hypothetical protein
MKAGQARRVKISWFLFQFLRWNQGCEKQNAAVLTPWEITGMRNLAGGV